jgi:hypothetical protein
VMRRYERDADGNVARWPADGPAGGGVDMRLTVAAVQACPVPVTCRANAVTAARLAGRRRAGCRGGCASRTLPPRVPPAGLSADPVATSVAASDDGAVADARLDPLRENGIVTLVGAAVSYPDGRRTCSRCWLGAMARSPRRTTSSICGGRTRNRSSRRHARRLAVCRRLALRARDLLRRLLSRARPGRRDRGRRLTATSCPAGMWWGRNTGATCTTPHARWTTRCTSSSRTTSAATNRGVSTVARQSTTPRAVPRRGDNDSEIVIVSTLDSDVVGETRARHSMLHDRLRDQGGARRQLPV